MKMNQNKKFITQNNSRKIAQDSNQASCEEKSALFYWSKTLTIQWILQKTLRRSTNEEERAHASGAAGQLILMLASLEI